MSHWNPDHHFLLEQEPSNQETIMLHSVKNDSANTFIQRTEDALEAYARGQFLLVSDDEDRENEGDLIIAAEFADAAAINFMITYGKGLVCLAISPEMAAAKKLRPMVERNGDHLGTAFTVSVDATLEHGVTTGISAPDRAKTIEVISSNTYSSADLQAPGHIFPLVARAGGILERQGHTEAAVELSLLAGLKPAGVIVEVIKADGEMARRPDLEVMAKEHSIQYITIKDLCNYVSWRKQGATVNESALELNVAVS
jgi:3,4-dihydroxy 2-butanone 4-phosphate synthase/GTP cyclohydrolase II